jgi:hypothetical protein
MAVTCTCIKIDRIEESEMDHSEAVQQMSAERFLLDELTVEERDEFEAHLFDCPECALDLRAGVALVNEAKVQLPQLIANASSVPAKAKKPKEKKNYWFLWQRPAFAGLAFACLMLVAYQNLITYPALRKAANQPRLLPSALLHGNIRGGGHLTIAADRKHGVALPVDVLGSITSASYSSYSVDLMDQHGKLVWSDAVAAPSESESASQQYSVVIPGATLENGQYTIQVSGVASSGERSPISRYVFEIRMAD